MKILIIQTAFLGDVILATPLVEALYAKDSTTEIHFLCRKGNQSLLDNNPKIHKVWVWDKSQKYKSMLGLIRNFRKEKFDVCYNVQRFMTSGVMTVMSGARKTIGFDKNPMSTYFTFSIPHHIALQGMKVHEVNRNLSLLMDANLERVMPKLYPSQADFEKTKMDKAYVTMSPSSVWFTKQYPREKWVEFIDGIDQALDVHLLGGPSDVELMEKIKADSTNPNVIIQAGKLSLLESAALMSRAQMNYTNDSGPTHMASAMNAPVTTMFCSTIPSFGFWPLSDDSYIAQYPSHLDCRPCGLHGKKECPKGHFDCGSFEIASSSVSVADMSGPDID